MSKGKEEMQEISEKVAKFNSKSVEDYSSIELASWCMLFTMWKVCASDAKVRKSVIDALKLATAELKYRDDIA